MRGRKKSSIMMDDYGRAAWNNGVRFLFSADNSRKHFSIHNSDISFRN